MQFIDFKKEHFSYNNKTSHYYIQISKDETEFSEIDVLEKKDNTTYLKTDFD